MRWIMLTVPGGNRVRIQAADVRFYCKVEGTNETLVIHSLPGSERDGNQQRVLETPEQIDILLMGMPAPAANKTQAPAPGPKRHKIDRKKLRR